MSHAFFNSLILTPTARPAVRKTNVSHAKPILFIQTCQSHSRQHC